MSNFWEAQLQKPPDYASVKLLAINQIITYNIKQMMKNSDYIHSREVPVKRNERSFHMGLLALSIQTLSNAF